MKKRRKEYQFEKEDQFWLSNQIRKSVDPSSALPTILSSLFPSLHCHLVSPFLSSGLTFLSPSPPPRLRLSLLLHLLFFSSFRVITFFCLFFPVQLGNGQIQAGGAGEKEEQRQKPRKFLSRATHYIPTPNLMCDVTKLPQPNLRLGIDKQHKQQIAVLKGWRSEWQRKETDALWVLQKGLLGGPKDKGRGRETMLHYLSKTFRLYGALSITQTHLEDN